MRYCSALLTLLVWVCPLAAQKQEFVAARLDAKEKQLESLYADYWRTEYKIALGNDQLSSRAVQENIRTVISDEQFLDTLKTTSFRNTLLRRRRDLFVEEATYAKISNDPKLTAIVEDVTREENTMHYQVGEQQLSRAELTDLVSHSPNRQRRQQA